MQKIASSGFRDCLFAIDDFLPALYGRHPRADVEVLPCVQKVRKQGFVALTFPDPVSGEELLCQHLEEGSDTNARHSYL